MLYFLGSRLKTFFGPFRLLESYIILIVIAIYAGFFLTYRLLPLFYTLLPRDREREFAVAAKDAKGKPTGSGVVFISIYVILCLLIIPLSRVQLCILLLTYLTMLTGFFDDKSKIPWGEYKKALFDLILSFSASLVLFLFLSKNSLTFWLPLVRSPVIISPFLYIACGTVLIWTSINTTNCSDGVDGLSATLTLFAVFVLGILFYFVMGHTKVAAYLLVPYIEDGEKWALMMFTLAGILAGYLWHNAFPSHVMMGDSGSRALGFMIGVGVLVSKNPLIILATSSIMLFNGGMGLLKVALLRFLKIRILQNIRFPLHDHMRKNRGWSTTQVLLKFLIMQFLITIAFVGIFFKLR